MAMHTPRPAAAMLIGSITGSMLSLAAMFMLTLALVGCGKSDSGAGDPSAKAQTKPQTPGEVKLHTVAEGKKPKVAFVTNGVASFWVVAEAGVKAGGQEYGVDVTVQMPPQGIGDQKRMVEDLLTSGIDGIAISPIDPANQTSLINDAARQTNIITQDSDAPASKRLLYIGMDNYDAGRMCGQLIKQAMPEGGSVYIFVGRLEQDNARRRRQGIIDELMDRSHDPARYDAPGPEIKGEKYTVLGTLTDQFDRAKAKANAEDAMNRHPDLGCMVGLFSYNPPLMIEAARQAGKLGKIKIVAFDEEDETLAAIRDGHCFGTVVQNPYMYGKESVRILAALAKGDRSVIPANGFVDIPARTITRDGVEAFWSDLKAKLGK
jgi:ribose transport system substrate-binding protein